MKAVCSCWARGLGVLGALLAGGGVVAGAMAAHALKDTLTTTGLDAFEIASRYQIVHALALVVVAVVLRVHPSRLVLAAGLLLLAGIICFSGSLYALAFVSHPLLGPITPIGGMCLILGWLCLAIAMWRWRTEPMPGA